MQISLPYLAFLDGRPGRHRHSKSCLTLRNVDMELTEVTSDEAPIAMSVVQEGGRTSVDLRVHDGLLYRRPKEGYAPSELPEYLKSVVFDASNEHHGVLTEIAKRGYRSSPPRALPRLPAKIATTTHTFVPNLDQMRQVFSIGAGFVVDDTHLDSADCLEDKARERYGRFLVIDGAVWVQSQPFVYAASPTGKVRILIGGHRQLPDDPGYVSRFPMYGDPNVRFFGAMSAEAAADHARVDQRQVGVIQVRDARFIGDDFDLAELERCACNVLRERKSYGQPHIAASRLLQRSLGGLLSSSDPDLDGVADVLSAIADLEKSNPLESDFIAFTPAVIDRFVQRWSDRTIEPVISTCRFAPR